MKKGDLVRVAKYTPSKFIFIRMTVDGTFIIQSLSGQVFHHYGNLYPA